MCAIGRAAGLDVVGVTTAAPLETTRRHLEARKARGLHGGMQFTYRNPARSTEPGRILDGAAAVVVGARSYRRSEPPRPEDRSVGRVASYAREHHYDDLRAALGAIATHLDEAGHRARVVADDNALVDRAVAQRAGLGFYGKNANLLIPGEGSWYVLGGVVTDATLEPTDHTVEDGCGSCTRCLDACPTGAIVAPGLVDARRCLAWLVQDTGPIPVEHREALGDRLYGCDDCQEVCPPNHRSDRVEPPPPAAPEAMAWVDLVELLEATDDELLARHGTWYVPRRDPRYLRRNALVVLGNVADPADVRARRVMDRYESGPDPLLAEHAAWARRRLAQRGSAVSPA